MSGILPEGMKPLDVVYGTGIALAGITGAVLAYNSLSPPHAVLNDYQPARKPPRLPRQYYKFNTSILDDDGDEEDDGPELLILHQVPR